MKPLRRIFAGASTAFFGRVGFAVTTFFFNLLAALLCGPEAFGAFIFVYSLMTLVAGVGNMGLGDAILKYVPPLVNESRWKSAGNVVFVIYGFVFLSTSVIALFLYPFSGRLASLFNKPGLADFLGSFLMGLPFIAVNELIYKTFRAVRLIKFETIFSGFLSRSVRILLMIVIFWVSKPIVDTKWILLYSFLASEVVICVMSLVFLVKRTLLRFDLREIANREFTLFYEIILFALPLMFSGIVQYGLTQSDILILGYYLDTGSIAIYRVAYHFAFMLTIIMQSFGAVVAPMISEEYENKSLENLGQIYSLSMYWSTLATLPLYITVILLSQELMSLFGNDFVYGSVALVILASGQMVNCATGQSGYMLMLTGRQKLFLLNSVIMVGLNVILCIVLVPRYGILGAAVAAAISLFGVNALRVVQVYLIHGLNPYQRKLYKLVLSGFLTYLIMLWLIHSLNFDRMASILIHSTVCFGIYILMLFLCGFEQEDRLIMSKLIHPVGSQDRRPLTPD